MILNLTTRTSHSCLSASKLSQVRDVLIAVSFTRNYYILIQLKVTTSCRYRLICLTGGGIFSTISFALVFTARNDAACDEERCAGPPHRGQGL